MRGWACGAIASPRGDVDRVAERAAKRVAERAPAARSIPEQAPKRVPRAARRQERVPRLVDVSGGERYRLFARERPREEVALGQRRSNRKDVGRVGAAFQLELVGRSSALVGPLGLARLMLPSQIFSLSSFTISSRLDEAYTVTRRRGEGEVCVPCVKAAENNG